MFRNVYTCTACEGRTLECFTCKIAMTKGSGYVEVEIHVSFHNEKNAKKDQLNNFSDLFN